MRIERRALKLTLITALIAATAIGVLSTRRSARAADAANYRVLAGAITDNGTYVMGFAPQTLKIHRGDIVTWQFAPLHNVHFATAPAELVVVSEIDGKPSAELNPAIGFPETKSGDPYKADASSGLLPAGPGADTFSMVMDVEPGTYNYLCDVHPGMVGTIVVVDDATTIDSPADVEKQGKADMDASIAGVQAQYSILSEKGLLQQISPIVDDTVEVANGAAEGNAVISRYFPSISIIKAGQSVKWTVPLGLDVHTVNFPLPADNILPDISVIADAAGKPHIVLPDTYVANSKDGDEVTADKPVGSGFVLPGASITYKFPKAGTYNYFCAIHPGQVGTVVVLE